jgi:hypothetical protein
MTRGFLALLLVLLPVGRRAEAHKPTRSRFTYHRDVRPILERRCGSCHRDFGVGPMSVLTYKDAFPWAVAIKNHVLSLSMPPWFADERGPALRDASLLTASEMNTIVDWCLGGTPEGDALPTPESEPVPGTEPPDRVLDLPEIVLGADRAETRQDFRIEAGLSRDRLLRSLALRPGRPSAVRSAVFYVVPKGASSRGVPVASWIAGEPRAVWPEGTGLPLPAGAAIEAVVHYKKTWREEGVELRDRSAVELYFAKGRPAPVTSFAAGDDYRMPRGVEILSFLPRAEAGLDAFHADAILPNGESLPLVRLRKLHPDWPRTYRLETPIPLPEGSALRMTPGADLVLTIAARE